ncbi:SDR family NAD(P)-dependent oxidoreductase [Candidatus Magnetomoraceae bacterium gMMP-1]
MLDNVRKKSVLITGGSSGLGFEMAIYLGKKGYRIFLLARNKLKMKQASKKLYSIGIENQWINCDVTNPKKLKEVCLWIKEDCGTIDFLILNAGAVTPKLLSDFSDTKNLKADLETNLWGTILSAYTFLPILKPGAKILMISSGFGLMGSAGYSVYCAAKAGIINFGEALRRELLSQHISIHIACPGDIDTPQFHKEKQEQPDWMKIDSPRKTMKANIVAKRILNECGIKKNNFFILPSLDVKLLVLLGKILPRKVKDIIIDHLMPHP